MSRKGTVGGWHRTASGIPPSSTLIIDLRCLLRLLTLVQLEPNLRVDLSTADFTGAWLHRVDLRCANLRMATITTSILRCDLRWADLRGATLRGCRISASDFRHADLRDADLRGAIFGAAQGSKGWDGCVLTDAQLGGTDLRGATYRPETVWSKDFDPAEAGATTA